MKNLKGKKHIVKNKNIDKSEDYFYSNDDNIVFVPTENIQAIKKVIDSWEVVKLKWDKMIHY